jgi:hypothetical protein
VAIAVAIAATPIPHNRCHTRGATIVREFVAGDIVRPACVPTGGQLPTRDSVCSLAIVHVDVSHHNHRELLCASGGLMVSPS